MPDEWRDANITAIHKKGSRADPGNYRGVSLTSVMGKLLVDGRYSDWVEVLSSVIQGSVLGGIVFNIFIDDIDDVIIRALIKTHKARHDN